MEHLNFTSDIGVSHNGVAEYSSVLQCSTVYTDVSKVPQYFKTSITVYNSVSIIVQQDTTIYSLLHFCKLPYMFRVVTPPIIRST